MPGKRQRAAQAPRQAAPPRGKRRRQGRKSDLYEAEDSDPEEEKHTDRYDHVENYEYELPSDFEDEEIDEEMAFTAEDKERYAGWFDGEDGGAAAAGGRKPRGEFADLDSSEEGGEGEDEGEDGFGDEDFDFGGSEEEALLNDDEEGEEDEEEEEDEGDSDGGGVEEGDERYQAMLAAALGRAAAAAADPSKPRRRGPPRVVAEAYPESEFAGDAGDDAGDLRVTDLVEGLGDAKAKLGAGRKLLERLERRAAPVEAPLPRAVRERQERKAGYEETSKDVTKWQPIVKANREAPTLRFTSARGEVADRGASTQALLEGFKPEGDMEAEVAALLAKAGAAGAKAMAEAERALSEQSLTPEEHRERAARLAKMRNVLFYAELKAKRLSKIKSKEFHRRANKAAKRAAKRALAEGGSGGEDGEGEDARRVAREEAEFERARERLTLKHKNSSRWARRALKRGVQVMDATTKAALAEQMAIGASLRRKIEGRRSGSDSDGGSDGSTSASDGEGVNAAGGGVGGLMSAKARSEALGILQGLKAPGGDGAGADADGAAGTGLFALPFMRRALEKQRAAAAAEAEELIRELEGGGNGEDGLGDAFGGGAGPNGGRLRFGGPAAAAAAAARRGAGEAAGGSEGSGSDEEEDAEAKAERLGRRLRGEPEPQQQQQQAAGDAAGSSKGKKAGVGGALPAAGLRRGAAAVATAGPVDVDMEALGEQQQQQQQQQQRTGHGGKKGAAEAAANGHGGSAAALRAASAANASADAQDWLFAGRGPAAAGAGQAAGGDAPPQPAFIAASSFGGARPGYVFKRGPRGQGYYKDKKAAAAAAAAAGTKQQQQQQQRKGKAAGGVTLHQQQGEDDSEGEPAGGRGARRRGAAAATAANGGSAAAQQQQQQQQNGAADDGERAYHMVPLSGDADAQKALLRRAFAADDVAAEFEAEKAAEVEEELPKEEAPGLMPGWGLWADQQREPKWMVEAKKKAARRKESAAAARKDAKMAHVVISEKWDKKAAKYGTQALPFPYRTADTYENAIRQPLGREVNPDAAFRNLTRPAVIKSTGVVIDPLRYSKGVADYDSTKAAKARGVITVAGGMPLQGEARGGGAGAGAAGNGKRGGGSGGKKGKK